MEEEAGRADQATGQFMKLFKQKVTVDLYDAATKWEEQKSEVIGKRAQFRLIDILMSFSVGISRKSSSPSPPSAQSKEKPVVLD